MPVKVLERKPVAAPQAPPAWKVIFGTSQSMALQSEEDHVLYTGARGPGKTDTQLMYFRERVGLGYGPFWRGIILDKEYKQLDDLVSKSKRWFNAYGDGARFLESTSSYKWVWPTGEELLFRSASKIDDYWNYHGQEFPFIGWNELCKYVTGELYDMMMSCNRSSYTPEKDGYMNGTIDPKLGGVPRGEFGQVPPPIPLKVFSTTNPYGPGHNWVKRRFITPAPYGVPVYRTTKVFDPATQAEVDVTKSQVAVFGSYRENIYLAKEYVATLDAITDENMRKAWLKGDWNIVAGGALDDVWNATVHVLPRFKVPSTWRIDRSLDWGSTHPFSVGFWAEANGEEATLPDGTTFCPPPGTLIQVGELYGTKEIGTNKGIKLSAGDLADRINAYEDYLLAGGWIAEKPWPGPADNQIRDVRESDVDTIEKKMSDKGISWIESDKSPGSRRNGLQLIRDRLEASKRGEGVGLYFMDHCRASIDLIPTMPRDPDKIDDVDTDAEDHSYDMARYRVSKSNNRIATFLPGKLR